MNPIDLNQPMARQYHDDAIRAIRHEALTRGDARQPRRASSHWLSQVVSTIAFWM